MTIGSQDVRPALDHCRAGRPDEAERLYRELLSQGAFTIDAMVPLAELARVLGLAEDAAVWSGCAVRLTPDRSEAWIERGLALLAGPRAQDAMTAGLRAVALAPRSASALRALAVGRLRLNQSQEAGEACAEALAIQPGYPEAFATLALVRMVEGRAEDADALFRRATDGNPTLADAFGNHAALLARLGRETEALERAERAIALRPRLASAHHLLGTLYRRAGLRDRAAVHFTAAAADPRHLDARLALIALRCEEGRTADAAPLGLEALAIAPADADTPFQVGTLFLRHGRRDLAVPYLRRAVRLSPGTSRFWTGFALALRGVRVAGADAEWRADLTAAFAQPSVDPADLVSVASGIVMADPAAAQLAEVAGDPAALEALLCSGGLTLLAGDTLLHALLSGAVAADAGMEWIVTALRRALLGVTAGPEQPLDLSSWGHPWLTLCARLAHQAFLGEYALAESPAETAAVTRLEDGIRQRFDRGEGVPNHWIALFGAYRPLHHLPALLAERPWPGEIARLLELQVTEPLDEARLAAELPALTPIRDGVSILVRGQYEENPYPRWAATGLRDTPLSLSRTLRTLFPQAPVPNREWPRPEVLVAGCGTGREAIWAARHIEGASVLAVDLSRRSLSYGARQSRRLGVGNVAFAQADLLELGGMERRFDLVHSVGVLHHMRDPLAGLRVLTGLLAPKGVMKLGLYSAIARRPIQAVRDFAAARGHGATPEGIRRLRQDILALPADDPVRSIASSPDFFTVSACRDLMLHVHETQATLPWLQQALDGLGLVLLGFEFEDPAVHSLYRRRFPDDPAMTSFAAWGQLEEEFPALFGQLYQFWVTGRE
ncbi:tetratricopeptide (TPR) repeat protein/SAM-dependent methyltransferase [Azospirillum agricola]|uniref:class I SAM-dependent methyltransferase n=1 Tax=Azospirillum agricola TaxID=1720247 RepID=UPI001AE7DA6B|nr:class I SAM-dependent methyltransferase [Azospirillum agricola]MBP2233308.1 tetratricopeptide (TPR) repeat protein/SAM-dependent methyltransferase [Azospirillum agricola]